MVDQIHLTEPGLVLCPVSPGANWDIVLEQDAGLGETSGFPDLTTPTYKESVYGCWTNRHQLLVDLSTDLEGACFVQPGEFNVHGCPQPFRADAVEQIYKYEKWRDETTIVHSASRTPNRMLRVFSLAIE